MSLNSMRKKVSFSLILLVMSLSLFVFASYAYFLGRFENNFSSEMGVVDVDLDAYFEVVTNSSNLVTGSDISFSGNTISSTSTDLSGFSNGNKLRVVDSRYNDGYYTVSGSSTTSSITVVETLTTESALAIVAIDSVTTTNIEALEVVIQSTNEQTGTDLSFTGSTITSSTTDLSVYSDGETIRIDGSTDNDSHYTVSGTPSSNSLTVSETFTTESAGASITIDEVITKPGVYYINIVSEGNEFYFEDFRLLIDVYSTVDTYFRVKIYEQLSLSYTDYNNEENELSVLFDGYMPFNYSTTNWYNNRTLDNYLYYQIAEQRVDESTPTSVSLIASYFADQDFSTYPVGYSLQIAFSIEAVQIYGGPEQVWGLATPPWGGSW